MIIMAAFLILYNAKENISYFYTPSELNSSNIKIGKKIRIGGFVKEESFNKMSSSDFSFSLNDNIKSVSVRYNGILPDLFREGQGVICEGKLGVNGIFIAERILAKHDENYMPPELKDIKKENVK